MKKQLQFTLMLALCLPFFIAAQQAERSGQWTILETFEVPGKASGLAWDGQYIYFGQYSPNGEQIHRLNPATGDYEFVCNGPMEDAYGLTWDGEYLWTTDHPGAFDPGIAYQFDLTGTVVSQFECPATYMGGIEYDAGYFWLAAYYDPDGQIYKTDDQGNVMKEFATPGQQPWDICLQDEFLWIADYNDDMIYKVDTLDGALIESHPCENIKPAGITYDGQYLWYVDGPLGSESTIYKVDLGGSGTPEINIPVTSYNYGNVAIGDSAVWAMDVENIGTAALEIETVVIQNAVPVFCWETFPVTIEAGESTEIELIFKPTETGTLATTVTVQSNDPVNPEVDVDLAGEAVISGPSINLLSDSHNYGNVRVNAMTRWGLQIENIGDESLTIGEINSGDPAFMIDDNVVLPMSVAPLEIVEVGIWFNPQEAISYEAVLEISSDDPQQPVSQVTLTGEGVDQSYPIGQVFWDYNINTGWDNSIKAITPLMDINGDDVDDVLVGSEDNFVRCFNGNSDGYADVFWEYEIYAGGIFQQNCLDVLPDIDGDGIGEAVFGTAGGDRSVTVLSGKTGELLWTFNTDYWGEGGWVYQVDASKDFNGDGTPDVLGAAGDDSYDTGPKRAFCLDGTDGSLLWDYFLGGPGFAVTGIEDVTGDDIPDAFAGASNESETQGKVVCIDGSTGFEVWMETTDGTSVWGVIQIDDVNGDGAMDLAAGDFGGYFYGFDGTNGDELFSGAIGGSPIILRLEKLDDVDQDGYADILFASSSSNCIVVSGYDGSNIWLNALADKAWNVDKISDISGDGVNDVIVGTLFQQNQVYFLDGTNGEELKSLPYGEAVDAISAIPDINGDYSMEMVAGGRDGTLTCFSGGLDASTFIPQQQSASGIETSCTPNPFIRNVQVSIRSEKEFDTEIYIMSAGGKILKDFGKKQISVELTNIVWDGRDQLGNVMNSGLYFLLLESGRYTKTVKLIKQ